MFLDFLTNLLFFSFLFWLRWHAGARGGIFQIKRLMGFFEPVRNFYFLGALGQALAALKALIGALVLRDAEGPVVHELAAFHIVVHDGIVINLKDARDFHLVGAGLAIAAAGAGDGAQALASFLDFFDDRQVGGFIEARPGAVGDFNVFYDLFHGAHAA